MRVRDENKEQAIRQKAMEIIVEEGFDRLSMQKLAKAANVSPATIYIYFKDREDLIIQLCVRESERMVESTMKNFDADMPFDKGLAIQWKNRADYWMRNPLESQFLEQIRHSPYHDKAFTLIKREFSKTMGAFVTGAIKRKELTSKLTTEVYWSVAFSPLYQLIKFHLSGKGMHPDVPFLLDDRVIAQTLNLVLKALKP